MPTDAPIPVAATADLLCGRCGYNVRGVPSDRCPECGRRFDPDQLLSSRLPWEQRRHIGRIRAYFRTVGLFTFHPHEATQYLLHPIDLRAARRFRSITLAVAFLALIGLAVLSWETTTRHVRVLLSTFPFGSYPPNIGFLSGFLFAFADPWTLAISLAAVLLSLLLAMMAAGALFCPRSLTGPQRQRAFAFGHYSCACLAIAMPLALIVAGFLWSIAPDSPRLSPLAPDPAMLIRDLGVLLLPFAIACLAWWISAFALLHHVRNSSLVGLLRLAVVFAAAHVVAMLAMFVMLHVVASFIVLFVLSFG